MKKMKNKSSYGENHLVAVSEQKKSKKSEISKGENLFKVLEDEVLGSLRRYF